MDFYPENILLEITARLNAPIPPEESLRELEQAGIAVREFKNAWWLEYFLRADAKVFMEHFRSQPLKEQRDLGVWWWRFFLHQPLMQRLLPAGTEAPAGDHWKLVRDRSLNSSNGCGDGGGHHRDLLPPSPPETMAGLAAPAGLAGDHGTRGADGPGKRSGLYGPFPMG